MTTFGLTLELQKSLGCVVSTAWPQGGATQPAPSLSSVGLVQPSPFYSWPIPFLRAQREQIEKERLEEEKKATGRLQHANELRRQVRENQQKQVQNRIATFEEGRRLKEEAQKRQERINDIKKKKLEELRYTGPLLPWHFSPSPKRMMSSRFLTPALHFPSCRASGLPEKYCIEAERKAKVQPAAL